MSQEEEKKSVRGSEVVSDRTGKSLDAHLAEPESRQIINEQGVHPELFGVETKNLVIH